MFANFFQWLARQPSPEYDRAFVAEVRVRRPRAPSPRMELVFLACWLLIALKHLTVIWAVHHYHVPFSPLWVNAPTWIFATTATAIFYFRE